MYNVDVHPDVYAEVEHSRAWYEKRAEALGTEFLVEVREGARIAHDLAVWRRRPRHPAIPCSPFSLWCGLPSEQSDHPNHCRDASSATRTTGEGESSAGKEGTRSGQSGSRGFFSPSRQKGKGRILVSTEPNTVMRIQAWIIEDTPISYS